MLDGTTYTPTSDVTLYAQWTPNTYNVTLEAPDATSDDYTKEVEATFNEKLPSVVIPKREYTVTFVGNGGDISKESAIAKYKFMGYFSSTGENYYSVVGNGIKTYDIAGNSTLYAQWNSQGIALATAEREGYTFEGWYTAPEGGKKIEGLNYTPTSDITLYARWSKNPYKVELDDNGATSTDHDKEVDVVYDEDMPTIKIPKKEYTVSYNGNGGAAARPSDKVAYIFNGYFSASGIQYYSNIGVGLKKYDIAGDTTLYAKWTSQSVTLPSANREGYTFDSWNTKADGSGTKIESSTYTPKSNITLYAQWTKNTYNVTLEAPDATSDDYTKEVEAIFNEKLPSVVIPKREYTVTFIGNGGTVNKDSTISKYKFTGYFSASGEQYYSTAGSGIKAYDIAGDATLYAQWTPQGIALATAEREGYTFDGWYTAPEGGMKIEGLNYTPQSDITLYAHWSVNQYPVTIIDVLYNPGGQVLGTTEILMDYGVTVYGSILGDSTDVGAYYEGYCYESCTSTIVSTSGGTVYRFFKAGQFKVIFIDWDDTVISEKLYYYLSFIDIPESPTRPDEGSAKYTFIGWEPEVEEKCTKDVVYKAVYSDELITYQVHFDPNGGKVGEVPTQTYPLNQVVKLPKNEYMYEAFEFIGWSYDPKATVPDFVDEQYVENVTDVPFGEVTLYAVWKDRRNYEIKVNVIYISTPNYTLKKTEAQIDAMEGYSDEMKALMKYMINDDTVTYNFATVFTASQIAKYKEDLRNLPYMDVMLNIDKYGTPYEEWIKGGK